MTDQSQIDGFVKWAKARLDEMSAAAKALEEKLGKLDEQLHQEGEQTVVQVRQWVSDGEAKLKQVQEQGEAALVEARPYVEKVWSDFETQANRWVERAGNQKETFDAQAKSQLASWQTMVDEFVQKASEVEKSSRADAEVEIERLKGEAKKAEAQLDELRKAGAASWSAMSKALDESRSAFEKEALASLDRIQQSKTGLGKQF
jgi:predicted  nucleic acid-binding Zn-ribbon protein